jgi:tetratricopeptide (TPR) repeat protein/DNA-binding Xre family transcriptional regulator
MPRSVKLHPDHRKKVDDALLLNGFLTQGLLAIHLEMALSTVNNFFTGKGVNISTIEKICDALGLDPQVIIQPSQPSQKVHEKSFSPCPFVPSIYSKKTWVGRESLSAGLLSRLQGQTRLLWITGISGIGKTTLGECLASQAWESDPSFQWIYLEILEGQSPDFASVADNLLAQLGDHDLDPQERNNPEQLAKRILKKLQSHSYWIQMDSLERLLNPEQPTEFTDPYWKTFFERCLTEPNVVSRLVLTAQAFPAALVEFSDRYSNVWQTITLQGLCAHEQDGKQPNEHLELFSKSGITVNEMSSVHLRRIGQIYEGHPLVLQVISQEIQASPFGGNLETYWQRYGNEFEQVARELQSEQVNSTLYNQALQKQVRDRLETSLKRLSPSSLELLCRSSVFRRPVPETFWLAMIKDLISQEQQQAYQVLSDWGLVKREGIHQNHFLIRQHNLIRSVAYGLLKVDSLAWQHAERQAAHLWLTVYTSAPNVPNLETVRGYMEAFYHYCEIEDWMDASANFVCRIPLTEEQLYWQLFKWGYYKELIQMSYRILNKAHVEAQVICLRALGNSYFCQGDHDKAFHFYEQGLIAARKINDDLEESKALNNLGIVHGRRGAYRDSIQSFNQSLEIAQSIGDFDHTGVVLGNLGSAHHGLGEYSQALEFHQRRLKIAHANRNHLGKSMALDNVGSVYYKLGKYSQAFKYYKQSLRIAKNSGSLREESNAGCHLGRIQVKLREYLKGREALDEALKICREIRNQSTQSEVLRNFAELNQALGEFEEARQFCQQALEIATELGIPLAAECETLLQQIAIEGNQSKLRKHE